jgi:hypothetical protein
LISELLNVMPGKYIDIENIPIAAEALPFAMRAWVFTSINGVYSMPFFEVIFIV